MAQHGRAQHDPRPTDARIADGMARVRKVEDRYRNRVQLGPRKRLSTGEYLGDSSHPPSPAGQDVHSPAQADTSDIPAPSAALMASPGNTLTAGQRPPAPPESEQQPAWKAHPPGYVDTAPATGAPPPAAAADAPPQPPSAAPEQPILADANDITSPTLASALDATVRRSLMQEESQGRTPTAAAEPPATQRQPRAWEGFGETGADEAAPAMPAMPSPQLMQAGAPPPADARLPRRSGSDAASKAQGEGDGAAAEQAGGQAPQSESAEAEARSGSEEGPAERQPAAGEGAKTPPGASGSAGEGAAAQDGAQEAMDDSPSKDLTWLHNTSDQELLQEMAAVAREVGEATQSRGTSAAERSVQSVIEHSSAAESERASASEPAGGSESAAPPPAAPEHAPPPQPPPGLLASNSMSFEEARAAAVAAAEAAKPSAAQPAAAETEPAAAAVATSPGARSAATSAAQSGAESSKAEQAAQEVAGTNGDAHGVSLSPQVRSVAPEQADSPARSGHSTPALAGAGSRAESAREDAGASVGHSPLTSTAASGASTPRDGASTRAPLLARDPTFRIDALPREAGTTTGTAPSDASEPSPRPAAAAAPRDWARERAQAEQSTEAAAAEPQPPRAAPAAPTHELAGLELEAMLAELAPALQGVARGLLDAMRFSFFEAAKVLVEEAARAGERAKAGGSPRSPSASIWDVPDDVMEAAFARVSDVMPHRLESSLRKVAVTASHSMYDRLAQYGALQQRGAGSGSGADGSGMAATLDAFDGLVPPGGMAWVRRVASRLPALREDAPSLAAGRESWVKVEAAVSDAVASLGAAEQQLATVAGYMDSIDELRGSMEAAMAQIEAARRAQAEAEAALEAANAARAREQRRADALVAERDEARSMWGRDRARAEEKDLMLQGLYRKLDAAQSEAAEHAAARREAEHQLQRKGDEAAELQRRVRFLSMEAAMLRGSAAEGEGGGGVVARAAAEGRTSLDDIKDALGVSDVNASLASRTASRSVGGPAGLTPRTMSGPPPGALHNVYPVKSIAPSTANQPAPAHLAATVPGAVRMPSATAPVSGNTTARSATGGMTPEQRAIVDALVSDSEFGVAARLRAAAAARPAQSKRAPRARGSLGESAATLPATWAHGSVAWEHREHDGGLPAHNAAGVAQRALSPGRLGLDARFQEARRDYERALTEIEKGRQYGAIGRRMATVVDPEILERMNAPEHIDFVLNKIQAHLSSHGVRLRLERLAPRLYLFNGYKRATVKSYGSRVLVKVGPGTVDLFDFLSKLRDPTDRGQYERAYRARSRPRGSTRDSDVEPPATVR